MKLIVLDRDGVINHDSLEYIKSPQEWQPIPGSLAAIAKLNKADWHVVVATNQSGVGRGLLDLNTLYAIHDKMRWCLAEVDGRVDGIFFCPHTPENDCICRKPRPGLLQQISASFQIDARDTVVVGDSLRDIEAARQVGATPILVLTGNGKETQNQLGDDPPVEVFADLACFADSWVVRV